MVRINPDRDGARRPDRNRADRCDSTNDRDHDNNNRPGHDIYNTRQGLTSRTKKLRAILIA